MFQPLDVSASRPPRRFGPRHFNPRRSGYKTFRSYTFRPLDPQDVLALDVTAPRRYGPLTLRPLDFSAPRPQRCFGPIDVSTPGRSRPWICRPWTSKPWRCRPWTFQTLDVPDPGRSRPGTFRPWTFQTLDVPDPRRFRPWQFQTLASQSYNSTWPRRAIMVPGVARL